MKVTGIGGSFVLIASLLGCAHETGMVSSSAYENMDVFMAKIAKRVREKIAGVNQPQPEDFQVVVTQADYPIGTILRPSSTIPIDYTSCLPNGDIYKAKMPSMFPSYKISKTLAVSLGLDNEVIHKLADFGVDIKNSDTINLSVDDAEMRSLSDRELFRLANIPACVSVISPGPVWIVRGYVLGKRTFSLQREGSNSLIGKISDIGSFKVAEDPGSASLDIADKDQSEFLQIVSQLTSPTVISQRPTPSSSDSIDYGETSGSSGSTGSATQAVVPLVSSSFEKPELLSSVPGRIYIQRDLEDRSNKGEAVLRALVQNTPLQVEPKIEGIKHELMPTKPTVKYFNANDEKAADQVLKQLQKVFPNAIKQPVLLPASVGQVEVWLPKVGSY